LTLARVDYLCAQFLLRAIGHIAVDFRRDDKTMKHNFAAMAAIFSLACLTCAPRAEAGHGIRIDGGNGTGCMSTYTTNSDNSGAAAFVPGGTYANSVACTPNSSNASDLFPNGGPPNDAATFKPAYTATGGEMFQYYTGLVSPTPAAQVADWSLPTGPFGTLETEIELNNWCPGGSGASFKFDGNTFTGGCGGTPTDLLFSQSGSLVGYVTDASDGTATIHAGTSVPGWTESGGAVVPLPSAAWLLLSGLVGVGVMARKRRGIAA
jgi:hypothetical protein